MSVPPLLDTNILLRHLLQDHEDHSPRATALLKRAEVGEIELQLTDTAIFETVFTLERFYRLPRTAIRNGCLPLIGLPGIVVLGSQRLDEVFELYVATRLSFADAYHAILAIELGSGEIISFDHGFDRVPNHRLLEP